MTVLINVVLPVFIVAAIAALTKVLLRIDIRPLSRLAFYLFTPALVFDALASSYIDGAEFGRIVAVVLLLTISMWILGALAAQLLKLEGATKAAFLVAILLMNAGNMGLSINLFAFGEPGMALASLYFPMTAILSSSLGVYLSARGKASGRLAIRRALSVPMAYAAVLGLLLNLGGIALPEPLTKGIHLLGQASVPTMLVVLGMKLAEMIQEKQHSIHLPALGIVTIARLLVAPALAFLFAGLLGLQGLARDVTVVESAMPTAVMSTILATEFETDSSFAALCVLVTTLVSMVTLTILLNALM